MDVVSWLDLISGISFFVKNFEVRFERLNQQNCGMLIAGLGVGKYNRVQNLNGSESCCVGDLSVD